MVTNDYDYDDDDDVYKHFCHWYHYQDKLSLSLLTMKDQNNI